MVGLFATGVATDLLDGHFARKSGETASPQTDALADALLLFGLVVGTERLQPDRTQTAAIALAPIYAGSQLIKGWLPAAAARRINQAHFFGSITLASVTLGQLGKLAGLNTRTVITVEALVLTALARIKHERLQTALK